jgi:hypothetical protein
MYADCGEVIRCHRPMVRLRASREPEHRAEAARHNLTVGLHAVTEFNQSIRYADTKAGALAAIQALAVTVLTARHDAATGGPLPALLFTVCLLGVLVSAVLLAAGQAPRLSGGETPVDPNRLAFPSLAKMRRADVLALPSPRAQQEDVWRQAADLATIAMAKYRCLHRAMVSTLGTLAAVLLWVAVAAWIS